MRRRGESDSKGDSETAAAHVNNMNSCAGGLSVLMEKGADRASGAERGGGGLKNRVSTLFFRLPQWNTYCRMWGRGS